MLSSKIQDTLNNQLKCEFQSAYTYLSLAAYFEDLDLNGFAHWMKIQYHEELMHAEKIYTYINDRDGRVQLQALDSPKSEWDSPLVAFKYKSVPEEGSREAETAIRPQRSASDLSP